MRHSLSGKLDAPRRGQPMPARVLAGVEKSEAVCGLVGCRRMRGAWDAWCCYTNFVPQLTAYLIPNSVLLLTAYLVRPGPNSLAGCATRIPEGQIHERSRNAVLNSEQDLMIVVADVLDWLARPDNIDWLLTYLRQCRPKL